MASEHRKARDRAKLEKFKERAAGRRCQVTDCITTTAGSSRYCRHHNRLYLRTGNPTGRIPEWSDYQVYVEDVNRLLALNVDHPAPKAGIAYLKAWLHRAVQVSNRESSEGPNGTYLQCHGYAAAAKAIERDIDMREVLINLTAAMRYLKLNGLGMDTPDEMVRTLSWILLRVIGSNDGKGGICRPWGNKIAQEIAVMLSGDFMRLLFNLNSGIDYMGNAKARMVEAMVEPMAFEIVPKAPSTKSFTFNSFEEVTPT